MRYFIILPVVLTLFITFQVSAQEKLPDGYPDRSPSFDALPGFINPPRGYGEVPFYWWQGDTLTRERLLWQLNQLDNKNISSLQINYSHLDSGGLSYGLSNPSKPALFTDEWWDLFKWFSEEARKRGMTVSLSDYTIGIGQGFSMDEAIKEYPDLNGSELKNFTKTLTGKGSVKLPENLLSVTVSKMNEDGSPVTSSRKNIMNEVSEGILNYNFGSESWKLTAVFSERLIPSYDPMNPVSGKAYNKYFFEKFETALPGKGSDALNFFFSDELNFRVDGNIWNKYFAGEFLKRKGYDVVPYLDALFSDIGDITTKIRLDYNDVIVSLSEENFFKPVFQWHQDRGMIFGCDHGGRGKNVAEFGDYFRTQRWNQGPGSDQPNLSKDIIKAKVAASISHLYDRPRVWLEGFHSSGWGTSSAAITDAVFANYVAGYNLLSFHGLYYSTMGGWWEWAPPDNHFRMPYWNQIDPLMNCIERLSYLLSQGYHSCDVAIIYPTEPVIAGLDGKKSVAVAFEAGERLYDNGIDFDFIDFESLARCEINNSELQVSGEKYKVLIVPSMKAIRYSSLKKIREFQQAGGIVLNIGDIPVSTELKGANDKETDNLINSIFSARQRIIQCSDGKSAVSAISGKYKADFKIISEIKERPYVMHRIIGKRDVFALYNLQEGTKCFFGVKGVAMLWNPWNGEVTSLVNYSSVKDDGTEITLPLSAKEIQIIVFEPATGGNENILRNEKVTRKIPLNSIWEFELIPSLDNRWGDYQLPAGNEIIGAQIREMHYRETSEYSGEKIVIDDTWKKLKNGFGTRFKKWGPLPELPSDEILTGLASGKQSGEINVSGKSYKPEEYAFSWKEGVEGDYGHQGYHGLKGNMYDNFIRLGAQKDVKMSKFRVAEPAGNYYIMTTSVIASTEGEYEILTGETVPQKLFVNGTITDSALRFIKLKKGANALILVYNKACETYLVIRRPGSPFMAKQTAAMKWWGDQSILPFDCYGNSPSSGLFAFESAPGLQTLSLSAYGKLTVWINGKKANLIAGQKMNDGLAEYKIIPKETVKTTSQVVIKVDYLPGFRAAGAFPGPIKQNCGKGLFKLGDWSETDGLKSYSGGAWYRTDFKLNEEDLKSGIEIDLGDLVSSAEVLINGKSAGIRLSPPFRFNIKGLAHPGENRIEVLVYNTLSNNYVGIPTRYRGSIKSGLTGPVTINIKQ